MKIERVPIDSVFQDPNNARKHNDRNISEVAASIARYGQQTPIVVDPDGVIIKGNGTHTAMIKLGKTEIDIVRSDLSGVEATMYAIADNQTATLADWDDDVLAQTLIALQNDESIDEIVTGFDDDEIQKIIDEVENGTHGQGPTPEGAALVPWTTVLDARQGYWQDRKKQWLQSGIESELGRDATPWAGGKNKSTDAMDEVTRKTIDLMGGKSSLFDPVLCEILYGWFCPRGGTVLDPFAGGSVRGIIAAEMGLDYTGIDLSERQINANREQVETRDMPGFAKWIHGDSTTDQPDGEYDFVMTCPPYYDLEVYSDGDGDISAMDYPSFCVAYKKIIAEAASRLKNDRFTAIVIGEVRDKKGIKPLRGIVPLTIEACGDAGLAYYNDAVLITPMGTVPLRCVNPFKKTRKLGRTHQSVLIFCKGDAKKAAIACGGDTVPMLDIEAGNK